MLRAKSSWKPELTPRQHWSLFGLLFLLYFYYFISSAGINCSNDGSHMALASALYHDHQLEVEKYKGTLVLDPDYAVKDGIVYSDRLPGNAILISPFLAYADAVKSVLPASFLGKTEYAIKASVYLPRNTIGESWNLDIVAATLLPNMCGVLGLFLLFLICHKVFLFNFRLPLAVMLVAGLCTFNYLESTHLFSHAPSMLLLTGAVTIALFARSTTHWKRSLYLLTGIIGFATLVELQNILFMVPLFLYVTNVNNFRYFKSLKETSRLMVFCSLIIAFFIGSLFFYNYLAFDDLTLKSNKYNPFFPEENSFTDALSGNFLLGLDQLFTNLHNVRTYLFWKSGVKNYNPGLLAASPIFLCSFLGFIPFFRLHRKECMLFVTIIFISSLIAAFHVTTLVRHIFTIHTLLFLPFIFLLDWVRTQHPKKAQMYYMVIAFLGLTSFLRQVYMTTNYFRNYDMWVFPYFDNTHIFLILNIPLLLGLLYLLPAFRKLRNNRSPATMQTHAAENRS